MPNGGLSRARNIGMQAARGDFLAYVDDDAYPDPHLLAHYAHSYRSGSYAAVGGPNIPPQGDGFIAVTIPLDAVSGLRQQILDKRAEQGKKTPN